MKAALMVAGLLPGLCAAHSPALPMTPFAAGGTGLTPFYVLGFELGPWQDYLARELTPAYLMDPADAPVRVTWMDANAVMILPAFAEGLFQQPRTWSGFRMDWHRSDPFRIELSDTSYNLFEAPGYGFERRLLSPGIFHRLNDTHVVGVEAVLAYQSFGTSRLGMKSLTSPAPGILADTRYDPYQETAYGTGVRLNVRSEIAPGMAIDAGFQSRIDMEEFAYYHGVYSNPADLDIPARASVGLAFQTHPNTWLSVSIERVMYSELNAFPSRVLPDRFLSLLGDSTSPVFTWDDLTVYSVGWTWNNGEDTQWRLDLSTRSQPSPTSNTLRRALSGELADNAMLVGFSRRTGESSRFNVNAAYAPADFAFGGNVLGVASESLEQNLELEAFWVLDF